MTVLEAFVIVLIITIAYFVGYSMGYTGGKTRGSIERRMKTPSLIEEIRVSKKGDIILYDDVLGFEGKGVMKK